jgi:hypothetical protein
VVLVEQLVKVLLLLGIGQVLVGLKEWEAGLAFDPLELVLMRFVLLTLFAPVKSIASFRVRRTLLVDTSVDSLVHV